MQQQQITHRGTRRTEPASALAAKVATIMDVLLDQQANVPYDTLESLMNEQEKLEPLIATQVFARIKDPAEINAIISRLKGYHSSVETQIKDVVSKEKQILEELQRAKQWTLDFFRVEHQERFKKEEEHVRIFNNALSQIDIQSTKGDALHKVIKDFSGNIDKRYKIHFLSSRSEELIRGDNYRTRISDEEVPQLTEEYKAFSDIYLSLSKATSLALIAPALSESDPKSFFHKCALLISSEPDIGSMLAPLAEWIHLRIGNQILLSSANQRLEQERMDFGVAVDFWVKTLESYKPEVTRRYQEEQAEQRRIQQEEQRRQQLAHYHELSKNIIPNLMYHVRHEQFSDVYRDVDSLDKQSILEQLAPELEALKEQPRGLARFFVEPKNKPSLDLKILEHVSVSFLATDIENLNNDNLPPEEVLNLKARIVFLASRMSESSRKAALDRVALSTKAEVAYASLLFELKSPRLTAKTWNEAVASTELV